DQGDDPGDDPVCGRDQSAHHPGIARGALSGNLSPPPGAGEWLARRGQCRARGRSRRADRAPALSPPQPFRDLPLGRGLLPAILFRRAEDRLDRLGNGAQSADDEAPAAGRPRVLPLFTRAAGTGALNPRAAWTAAIRLRRLPSPQITGVAEPGDGIG